MKFKGTLIVSEDIEKSAAFYKEIMKEELLFDFGTSKQFKSGLTIQSKESMSRLFHFKESDIKTGGSSVVLYFETEKFDDFTSNLKTLYSIEYIHDVLELPWGQRSISFYDPDKNTIDVSESMKNVITRMRKDGMSIKQISEKTEHPIDFIESICSSLTIERI